MAEQKIFVGVGAVVEDDIGRILLVKHKPERRGFWQGKWICPGGELEFGEVIEEGIKREVREETQLTVELVRPLLPFDRIVWSKGKIVLHVIYLDYLAGVTGGTLKPGSDVGEAMWVDKKKLAEIWGDVHEDAQKLLEIAGIKPR